MTRSADRFTTPVAVHLFLTRGDDVLMLSRFNTGYEDGNYSVIAGHLDGGETIVAAMCREAREEAGVELDPASVEVVGMMHRLSNDERIDFFLATDRWSGDVRNVEPHKCDELRWVPIYHLPDNTIPYVTVAVENWRNGDWFGMFGWNEDAEGAWRGQG